MSVQLRWQGDVEVRTEGGQLLRKGQSKEKEAGEAEDQLAVNVGSDPKMEEAIGNAVRRSARDLSATTAKIDKITGATSAPVGSSYCGSSSSGSSSNEPPPTAPAGPLSGWAGLLNEPAADAMAAAAAGDATKEEVEAAMAEVEAEEAEAEAEEEEADAAEEASEEEEEEVMGSVVEEEEEDNDEASQEEASEEGEEEVWGPRRPQDVVTLDEAVALGLISSSYMEHWCTGYQLLSKE
jgi:hypothetical protein